MHHRRPALDRDRQPRDADGARLPAGGLRAAADPGDPREPGRADQPPARAGRPRSAGRLVLPPPQGQDRLREAAAESRRPTGASTSSTTTTGTACSDAGPDPRVTQDASSKWHPIVVHDLHESMPLLSIWTGTGPYNPNLDPITTSEWHAIAFHEARRSTGHRHAGGVDLGLRRGLVAHLRRHGGHQPQQRSAAATRPSATAGRDGRALARASERFTGSR